MVGDRFTVSIYVSFDDLTFKLTNKSRSDRPALGDRETVEVEQAWGSPLSREISTRGHSAAHSSRYS